jgi:protein-tyrosine phosphatase
VLNASAITRNLSVGAAPEPGYYSARFDTLVLVSEEYQPPDSAFPGIRVRRFPFDDSVHPSPRDFETAWAAGEAVARDITRGRRVLVTCSLGRNRSALVAAIALYLVMGVSGAQAANLVRARRVDAYGVRALSNPAFRRFLRGLR